MKDLRVLPKVQTGQAHRDKFRLLSLRGSLANGRVYSMANGNGADFVPSCINADCQQYPRNKSAILRALGEDTISIVILDYYRIPSDYFHQFGGKSFFLKFILGMAKDKILRSGSEIWLPNTHTIRAVLDDLFVSEAIMRTHFPAKYSLQTKDKNMLYQATERVEESLAALDPINVNAASMGSLDTEYPFLKMICV
jgi:hypothetical protein